jgi:predicted O-linked N-acetylglucosamine transferase (SPINDLY family)
MVASPQALEQAAQAALNAGDFPGAIALRQQLRSIQPNQIENLLHLMMLAMYGQGLSLEQFSELNLIAQLDAAADVSASVDPTLIFQCVDKLLENPFLALDTAEFLAACLRFGSAADINNLVGTALPSAMYLGHKRGYAGLAAALVEACLGAHPGDVELLMQLSLLCRKANVFDRAVSTAQECLQVANNDTDRLKASALLLGGRLNAGGSWDQAVAMVPAHRSRIATLVQAKPILSRINSCHLLPTTYFLPYLEDRPSQNHPVQNQLIAVCELGLQTHGQASFDRYQASHARRATQAAPQKLKVGYVCHCFHSHSVGWLARWLLRYHDANQIELYAYMLNPVEKADAVQEEYRQIVPNLRECGLDGLEIAEQIFQDGIDILVDLDSLTLDVTCEVMALKPAPIQVTWLGWDASGLSTIDYYLADRHVLPENAQDYYVEEIWRLPSTYLAVDGFEVGEADLTRELLGIPADAVVYYSGQRGYKRHRDTVLWQLQIVAQVPQGILLVKGLADEDAVKVFFYQLADQVGLDRDRLRFLPQAASEPIHRANLALADIVLDTFPYNGATTTMEALWMERPLVTLVGEQFAARNSYTMLINAGVEAGIAWSPEEYVAWGVRLGLDAALRSSVVEQLHRAKTEQPLWQGRQFARDVEAAYQSMAQRFWAPQPGAMEARQARIDRARAMEKNLESIARLVLVFINWQQEEEALEEALYGMLEQILGADRQVQFLLDTTGIDGAAAEMMLGGALMNFLMMQEIETAVEPNIAMIPPLDQTALDRLLERHFHCAKLVCGTVDLQIESLVGAIANY